MGGVIRGHAAPAAGPLVPEIPLGRQTAHVVMLTEKLINTQIFILGGKKNGYRRVNLSQEEEICLFVHSAAQYTRENEHRK